MAIELVKECTLGFYKNIAALDEEKDVYLIQNELTNKVFVKKILKMYNIEVYIHLKKHPHKNIPKIYELFEHNDQLIIIEEFVNGENLEELINKEGKLEDKFLKEYILQILDGLDHIHNLKPPVIHRDIKLSNVMITNDGIVKIIDFNTSRLYDKNNTKDTVILGTAGYAAPEQFGFGQTDCRSDIYALGVLMNYLLTGKHPHDELYKGEYESIIEKCTNLSPDKRFTSTSQLRTAFNKKSYNPLGGKGLFQSLWPIPGFRTKKVWKMITAIWGYVLIFSISLSMENTNVSVIVDMMDRFVFLAMLLTLVILYTNYLNIQNRLPLCKNDNFFRRIIGRVLFTLAIVIFFATLSIFVSTF